MQPRWAIATLASLALAVTAAATAQAASPTVTTRPATSIGQTAATLRGTVNPQGLPASYAFQWGTTTGYGQQTPDRPAGRGTRAGEVSFRLRGLTPGVTYRYRLVATNADGTTVGADRAFTTDLPPVSAPAILATAPFSPFANSVTLTALINPGGAATTYRFQFGTTTSYGVETAAQTIPAGVQPVAVRIGLDGLQARTTYRFRTVASNRRATVVGPDATFTTGPFPPARIVVATRPRLPRLQRRSYPWFVTTGALRLPAGVGVQDGCNGIVGVRFTSSGRTVASKRVRLASGHCSYRLRVRALPPRGKDRLRVHVRFYGNAILTPQDARTFLVGVR